MRKDYISMPIKYDRMWDAQGIMTREFQDDPAMSDYAMRRRREKLGVPAGQSIPPESDQPWPGDPNETAISSSAPMSSEEMDWELEWQNTPEVDSTDAEMAYTMPPAPHQKMSLPPQQMPPAELPHQQMSLPPQQMPGPISGFGDIMGVVQSGNAPSPEQARGKKMQEARAMIEQRILDQRAGRHTGEDQVLGLNETEDGYYLQIGGGEPREVFFDDVI